MGRQARPAVALMIGSAVLALSLLAAGGCGGAADPEAGNPGAGADRLPSTPFPDVAAAGRQGEELFNANCSACHGVGAAGTSLGPPLVHRVYHPGHHPDFSIRNAVAQGVPQHHWPFGDMAPVSGVEPQDVEKVVCYIRQQQRAGGIFKGDEFGTVC